MTKVEYDYLPGQMGDRISGVDYTASEYHKPQTDLPTFTYRNNVILSLLYTTEVYLWNYGVA